MRSATDTSHMSSGACFRAAASSSLRLPKWQLVRDSLNEVARIQTQWRDLLLHEIEVAAGKGELPETGEPVQLAFEIEVILA